MKETMKPGPAAMPAPSSFLTLLSGWVQQGVESFFATQRILVDLAMRQNASAMKTLREGLSDPEHSPAAILTELAVEGTANFVEAQRILLSLAEQENEIVMSGVKERVGTAKGAIAMTDLVRRGIATFVDMQEKFLTITSKQTQAWLQAAKAGKPPYNANLLIEVAREGMDNFVHAQKKFLDIISEETTRATSGKQEIPKMKKTELSKLAREAANAFIEAQKKLLDVAGQQMNVNLQMAGKSMDMMTPLRLPIASLTGEGVKSFVDAEKQLIDTMMKGNGHKVTVKAQRKPKRAARARKTEAAHAARVGA